MLMRFCKIPVGVAYDMDSIKDLFNLSVHQLSDHETSLGAEVAHQQLVSPYKRLDGTDAAA